MLVLLAIIIGSIGLGLLTPLVLRDLIDRTLPAGDVRLKHALLRIWQRALDASIGSAGLCPPAAHVASELVSRLNRRGGCTERGHQYAGGRDHQRHLGVGDAGRGWPDGMAVLPAQTVSKALRETSAS